MQPVNRPAGVVSSASTARIVERSSATPGHWPSWPATLPSSYSFTSRTATSTPANLSVCSTTRFSTRVFVNAPDAGAAAAVYRGPDLAEPAPGGKDCGVWG